MQTDHGRKPTPFAAPLIHAMGRGPKQGTPDPGGRHATEGGVGGWRLLLALVAWVALSVTGGVAAWTGLGALAPGWGGTDGRVLVVAGVYLALVLALLLAFGGLAGLRDRLLFRYTSAGDLRLAFGVWGCAGSPSRLPMSRSAPCWGRRRTPCSNCFASARICPAFPPPGRSRSG